MNSSISPESAIEAARQRLARLDAYLREDPGNQALNAEAFEAALRCGEWERAEAYLRTGQFSGQNDLGWALREGDMWMARQNWHQAQLVLESLQKRSNVPTDFYRAVQHNLAYIDFQKGDYSAGIQRLAPILEDRQQSGVHPALQLLWLRILHRLGELDRACCWAKAQENAGMLGPEAAGVASLIALDASDLAAARRWSLAALDAVLAAPKSIEALVTQSSLALADQNGAGARRFANEALSINPTEGRAWSTRAFADLLEGELSVALKHFEQALAMMPQHIGTWHGKAWTQILLKDLDAAQSTFETALEMDRNFAESHGGLAVVLALKQKIQEAQFHIDRALRLDPENLSGRYAQAIVDGDVHDANSLKRFAHRLLGTRSGPLGRKMSDWLPGQAPLEE